MGRRTHPVRPLGRQARPRLRGRRRGLVAAAPGLARRRGDGAWRALRAPSSPDPRGRVLPRPPARPLGAAVAPPRRRARGARGRAGRVDADRRLRGTAAVVARLGRPRLVQGAARAPVRVPVVPARELDLQHGRRGQPAAPRGLHVPLAPRDRVRARGRPPLRRGAPPDAVDRRRRGWSPMPASSGRIRGPRSRRSRSVSLVLAVAQRRWRPAVLAVASVVVSGVFLVALPDHRPVDVLHAGRARMPARQRRRRGRHRWRALGWGGVHGEPPAQPARRYRGRPAPPLGVRPRQCGRVGEAHGCRDPGRRVDLHRARRRRRAGRRAALHRLAGRARGGALAEVAVARRRHRRDRRPSGCRPT